MDGELLSDQPLSQKLIRKGFWVYIFMILITPIGYFIRVIVSNRLDVGDVGLFYSILGLITLISLYNDLGLTEALQYYLPKYWIQKKFNHYKTIVYVTLATQLATGIIIAGIIYLGASRLAVHHFHSPEAVNIIRILCFYFIGVNFLQAFNSFYIAFQDVVSFNLPDLFKVYSTLIFTIFFRLTNSLTSESFSIAWITGLGISLGVSTFIFLRKYLYTLKKGTFTWDKSLLKKQFKYAFWVFLGANIGGLFGQVDQQLVVNFLGLTAAGYYTNFLSLYTMYNIVITPAIGMLFPIVTELATKNETQKLCALQNILYKYFSVFALTIGGIFFALGPQLATIFFGVKFLYSGELVVYLAPSLILNILITINYSILAGLGKVKERVKIMGWALLVNILSNILLILIFKTGLIGAVISMILGWIVLWLLSLRLINKNSFISFDRNYFIINLGVISFLTGCIFALKDKLFILDNSHRFSNIYWLVIILIIYYGIILLVNSKSIRTLIREIRNIKK